MSSVLCPGCAEQRARLQDFPEEVQGIQECAAAQRARVVQLSQASMHRLRSRHQPAAHSIHDSIEQPCMAVPQLMGAAQDSTPATHSHEPWRPGRRRWQPAWRQHWASAYAGAQHQRSTPASATPGLAWVLGEPAESAPASQNGVVPASSCASSAAVLRPTASVQPHNNIAAIAKLPAGAMPGSADAADLGTVEQRLDTMLDHMDRMLGHSGARASD